MYRPRPTAWLQWTLALVIGHASLLVLLRQHPASLHGGVPPAIVTGLASVELLAVILFLIPATLRLGARLLWTVLAVAALLHLHAGEPTPSAFLVYAAGVWVVLADARDHAKAAS